jgi:hypothetical protein
LISSEVLSISSSPESNSFSTFSSSKDHSSGKSSLATSSCSACFSFNCSYSFSSCLEVFSFLTSSVLILFISLCFCSQYLSFLALTTVHSGSNLSQARRFKVS